MSPLISDFLLQLDVRFPQNAERVLQASVFFMVTNTSRLASWLSLPSRLFTRNARSCIISPASSDSDSRTSQLKRDSIVFVDLEEASNEAAEQIHVAVRNFVADGLLVIIIRVHMQNRPPVFISTIFETATVGQSVLCVYQRFR
ncbi:uncharacterized protein ATNIH1004_000268 [Aspergillus tanneri]|uniref:Uncharacterized protein n=1 Tax=Aspergillus tanneri TaxID=1220188 RepID=A0A5M9MZH1_9EURO|nr:uncharacterized protein ATNIH1004_000268 [Aspergillus tanneri]KAA8651386.1 hypothetical protein ATNIH1004_000268 [Aspergillus tanneri]